MRRAFTILELLVVIAIVGLLVALLLPAVQAARESARAATCRNNLRQIALGCEHFHQVRGVFPAYALRYPSWSWGHAILPYIDEQPLYERWDQSQPLLAPVNLPLAGQPLAVFKCPSALSEPTFTFAHEGVPTEFGTSDYKGCQSANASDPLLAAWGQSGWLSGVVSRACVPARKIVDGLSRTLLIVESTGGRQHYGPDRAPFKRIPQVWASADGNWVGRALSGMGPGWQSNLAGVDLCLVNCVNMYDVGPYSFHSGGANVSLCDGSVRFASEDIDPLVISALYCYYEGQSTGAW